MQLRIKRERRAITVLFTPAIAGHLASGKPG